MQLISLTGALCAIAIGLFSTPLVSGSPCGISDSSNATLTNDDILAVYAEMAIVGLEGVKVAQGLNKSGGNETSIDIEQTLIVLKSLVAVEAGGARAQ